MDRETIDPLEIIEQAESLWPHNTHAVEDPAVSEAVQYALSKPTDAPNNVALLRRAGKHSSRVRRLFDVVFGKAMLWSDFDFFEAPCDRCLGDIQPQHSLWVPAGATVVEVHMCADCRVQVDALLTDLVWD
ncbi:hypothetical protein [Terrabacter terrigena]|uniref:Uncharacterized protein n=1 Tax=Terrabacter terrigena TaxID=574718 RepID=A0ABW3N0X5_9MICO